MQPPIPAPIGTEAASPTPGQQPPIRLAMPDRLRGLAVMGILLMNIVGFGLPDAAYTAPAAWGLNSLTDKIAWLISFLLVDGKMRGLFALLYGAGMMMMLDKARQASNDGWSKAAIRSLWLGIFGLLHYIMLWWGDILTLYAMIGLVTLMLAGEHDGRRILIIAGLAFALYFLLLFGLMRGMSALLTAAAQPDAAADTVQIAAQMMDDLGRPGSIHVQEQLTLYRGGWLPMAGERINDMGNWLTSGIYYTGPEIAGFMLLGMALLRNDFITGEWPRTRYRTMAAWCLIAGMLPMVGLAYWVWASDFDTLISFSVAFIWSFPFRILLTIGITAWILMLMAGKISGPLLSRLEATGRMSLSNYLLTSLLMTALFYGWGLGWFGTLSRAQLYWIVPPMWAIMLLWSRPYLAHFGIGPAEWLWRWLIRKTTAVLRARTLGTVDEE